MEHFRSDAYVTHRYLYIENSSTNILLQMPNNVVNIAKTLRHRSCEKQVMSEVESDIMLVSPVYGSQAISIQQVKS